MKFRLWFVTALALVYNIGVALRHRACSSKCIFTVNNFSSLDCLLLSDNGKLSLSYLSVDHTAFYIWTGKSSFLSSLSSQCNEEYTAFNFQALCSSYKIHYRESGLVRRVILVIRCGRDGQVTGLRVYSGAFKRIAFLVSTHANILVCFPVWILPVLCMCTNTPLSLYVWVPETLSVYNVEVVKWLEQEVALLSSFVFI